jgi:hypothetical protein
MRTFTMVSIHLCAEAAALHRVRFSHVQSHGAGGRVRRADLSEAEARTDVLFRKIKNTPFR